MCHSCVTTNHVAYIYQNKDGISHTDKGEKDEKELFEDCSYAYRSCALGSFLLTANSAKE